MNRENTLSLEEAQQQSILSEEFKNETLKVSRTLRVLYVEDNLEAMQATVDLFHTFFENITTATDGFEGYEKFKEANFDLIISDIRMPGCDGITMVRNIREINSDIPVIFLSAHSERFYLIEAIRLGIDEFLFKPLEVSMFVAVLSKVCNKIERNKKSTTHKDALEKEVTIQTQELQKKLYFDELTGLYNRSSLSLDIKNVETPILFIIDINKFKMINELYGAECGSRVLVSFANFLRRFIQDTTYRIYRISGDEFVIRDTVDPIDPEKYEKDLERFFSELNDLVIRVDDEPISIEVTIGIATSQHDTLECAKIALDHAKTHNQAYMMYSEDIDNRSKSQEILEWKKKLKSAMQESRIVPVFQPIVDKDGKTVKYETLMRYKDKDTQELVSPYYFLDVAIKTNQYAALSTHIIFEGLEVLRKIENELSFNFIYSDIENVALMEGIESFLINTPEVGKKLIFEIVESEDIKNYRVLKKFIKRFRKYNVRFAVDDFGSGFSNFEHILEIEPDYIKIDGSLVKNMDTDEKAHILVQAIVEFSHKLGIKVIAEYVHSEEIFKMLEVLDVDEYQGFYFSEPLESIG